MGKIKNFFLGTLVGSPVYKSYHKKAVDFYKRELGDFIEGISQLDQKGLSDLLILAVRTRAGLQIEGYIKSHDGEPYNEIYLSQHPILESQFGKIAELFREQKSNFHVASMLIWVHTLRALQMSQLESEIKQLWNMLMGSKKYWEESLNNIYEADIKEGINPNLVNETMEMSKKILEALPPRPIRIL